MPRRGQDGGAAQASADFSVIQEKLRAQRNPQRRRALANEKAREIDGDYFRAHPGETTYTRPYLPGEGEGGSIVGVEPDFVIVGQAGPGAWIYGAVFSGRNLEEVKAEVERRAITFKAERVAARAKRVAARNGSVKIEKARAQA